MDLVLWRHAEAEDTRPDHGRRLTARGRAEAETVAAWLRARVPAPVRVLASPLARARETAAALAPDHALLRELDPFAGATAAALLRALGWPDGGGTVVAVGHQPLLGRTASLLLAGVEGARWMRPGAIWWLATPPPGGEGDARLRAAVGPDLA